MVCTRGKGEANREITVQLQLNQGRKVVRREVNLKVLENKRGVEEKIEGKREVSVKGRVNREKGVMCRVAVLLFLCLNLD